MILAICSNGSVGTSMESVEVRDHLGRWFRSEAQMCKYYGVLQSTFKARLKLGWHLSECLLGRPVRDMYGIPYNSLREMCDAYDITYEKLFYHINRGFSLEDILLDKIPRQVSGIKTEDHLGNKFDTLSEMLDYWNVTYVMFYHRKHLGWDLKAILETPVDGRRGRRGQKRAESCVDHKGNHFDTIEEMVAYWGISRATYDSRKQKGWSLEEILETDAKPKRQFICKDHLGNEFKSLTEMTQHWGISLSVYKYRRRKGWSLEKILESKSTTKTCQDHLGNEFRSVAEMVRYWGVARQVYDARKKSGLSLEKCLTGANKVKDHLGVEYGSLREMCKAHGVVIDTYYRRLKCGLSLEECLSPKRHYYDHKGEVFSSIAKMCEAWGVLKGTFYARKAKGWTLEECLIGKEEKDEGDG